MRALIILAASTAFATSAMAADVIYDTPVETSPVSTVSYDWSGFYAGVNAGYGFSGDTDIRGTVDGGSGSIGIDGFVGGGQIGYNWQSNQWVFGVEADIQYSDISGTLSGDSVADGFVSFGSELDYFGTVRGRVGYAFDNVLPYVTGGFAYGRNELTYSDAFGSASDDKTHTGYTIGGGVEYGLTEQASVKVEYLYTDLGDKSYFQDFGNPIRTDVDFHTVRAGLNIRF
jgi:outer membrane immunogenic protein